jgi:flagellar basal body-associated protein FliL
LSEVAQVSEADPEDTPQPRKPPVLLLAAAGGALVVGVGLGFGAALLVNVLTAPPPPPPPPVPEIAALPLEALSVNLRGTGGQHTLRVAVGLEVATIDREALPLWGPILQDSVLVLASDFTADELLQAPGRERFRKELRHRIDLVLPEDLVDVHVTELVVQ